MAIHYKKIKAEKEDKSMKKLSKMNNKGFSLVELIIVMAIMAVLVGALAPQLIKYVEKSRITKDTQALQTIHTAIQTAIADDAVQVGDFDVTDIFAVTIAGTNTANYDLIKTDAETLMGSAVGLDLKTGTSNAVRAKYDGAGKLTIYGGLGIEITN